MFVVSCHDVDALRDALIRRQDDVVYRHLAAVHSRHVLVVPTNGLAPQRLDTGGVKIAGDRGVRVTRITQLWQDIIRSDRLVRVKVDDELRRKLVSQGVTESGACHAAAFHAASADVLVTIPQDAQKLRESRPSGAGEVCSLEEYAFSRAALRERDQTCHLWGLSSKELASRVLKPLVMWAKSVTLIDPYIGRRLAGLLDGTKPQREIEEARTRYQAFIRLLTGVWLHDGRALPWGGYLTLCTEFVQKMGDATRQRKLITDAVGECVVKEIGATCARSITVAVRLTRGVCHDRYLLPGKGIIAGFTHGFDILHDDVCAPCDVYLRRLGQDRKIEIVTRVLTAPEAS